MVAYDRNWYDENVRNRIFSENALLRRIDDDDDEGDHDDGNEAINDDQAVSGTQRGGVTKYGQSMTKALVLAT